MKKLINIPNILTVIRILGAASLLAFVPGSLWFIVIYTVAGITDGLDGYIARKTGKVTVFGAKLDSAADLLFYGVMLICIFPVLWQLLPWSIWVLVAVVIAVRLCAYLVVAVRFRRFSASHTWMNKTTGAFLFAVPYLIATPVAVGYCWAVAVVALVASCEELLIHLLKKQYDGNTKTVLSLFTNK